MRNLKTLGLAFAAVLALGVAAAPAASADTTDFWAEEGADTIDATGESVQTFTLPSLPNNPLTCPHVFGDAEYNEQTKELTGTDITYDDFNPPEHECHVVVFGITFPVTVDENNCHFKFTGGSFNTETDIGHGSLHIENCDNGSLTITMFETDTETLRCTFHVHEQEVDGITYHNVTTEDELMAVTIEADEVEVETEVTDNNKLGCNENETPTAKYNGDIIAKGTNKGNYVDATVTGTATE